MTLQDRVLRAVVGASRPLDDDELAGQLHVARQAVNQICRRLAARGVLRREPGPAGKIVNQLPDRAERRAVLSVPSGVAAPERPEPPGPASVARPADWVTEDEVKAALAEHLERDGFTVTVAWGRQPGVDVVAVKPGHRWLIEAKGSAPKGAQQHNYFLNALGELVQRTNDPEARYGLALPDSPQYRGLVERLPTLARERLKLHVFFVGRRDSAVYVREAE